MAIDPLGVQAPVEEATGFWRLARPAALRRPWLVGPDGRATFMLGVNSVMRDLRRKDGVAKCAGIREYIDRDTATDTARIEWARLSDGRCGAHLDPQPYGFNAVGAFSETNDFDDSGGDSYMIRAAARGGASAPYTVALRVAPGGEDRALKDANGVVLKAGFSESPVGDPFNPAFLADLDALAAGTVAPRRHDPRLQMWFAGNEIGIFDIAMKKTHGVRDFRRWIWSDVPAGSSIDRPRCARHELAVFLRERYDDDLGALRAAWDADYADFAAIVDADPRPVPFARTDTALEDLQRFVHDRLLRAWVRAVTTRIRDADPNHLVASPRLAIANHVAYQFWTGRSGLDPDVWADAPAELVGDDTALVRYSPLDVLARDGRAGFDLVAVNAYIGAPAFQEPWLSDGLARLSGESGLPVLISEFGVRAKIAGWSNLGGAPAFVKSADLVEEQRRRGLAYASQIDQFIGCPEVVGACWHAWSDRFNSVPGSDQINLGLVQCTDPANALEAGARWPPLDGLIADTNATIIDRIAAKTGL